VFLDYEQKDTEFVGGLAVWLEDYKIRQFFAMQDVLPGEDWDLALDKAIRSSATIVVFIGGAPISANRWERVQAVFNAVTKNPERRIIPVLLPGSDQSDVPPFLRSLSAVDFRSGLNDQDAFRRLLSGITGRKLEDIIPLSKEQTPKQSRISESPVLTPEELHFQTIVKSIAAGRLVPFLGPDVNQANRPATANWKLGMYLPTNRELAAHLLESFGYSDRDEQSLARVSQVISLMSGSGPLYEALHNLYAVDYPPTSLHNFLAALPSMLSEKGYSSKQLLVVTTNYDDLLERAFRAVEEPFDLVFYVAEGENRGRFRHRSPTGDEQMIDRPNEYSRLMLENRTVILKIHGAVDRKEAENDSFMITEDDHIRYVTRGYSASQIPSVLMAKLRRSSFLFLGCSLHDWTMRSILQSMQGEQVMTYTSWAIQWGANNLDEKFWASRNVEMFNMPLDNYSELIRERLKALPPAI
jgi:hypothetical protein